MSHSLGRLINIKANKDFARRKQLIRSYHTQVLKITKTAKTLTFLQNC